LKRVTAVLERNMLESLHARARTMMLTNGSLTMVSLTDTISPKRAENSGVFPLFL